MEFAIEVHVGYTIFIIKIGGLINGLEKRTEE
jgi:hypothetical protein